MSENEKASGKRDDGTKDDGRKEDSDAPQEEEGQENGEHDSRIPLIIAGVVAGIVIIAFVIYWLATMDQVTTDDAYTDGRAVSIASNVSGYVTELNIDDNTFVRAGDLLIAIDPREDEAALEQARSNLALAESQLASSEVDLVTTRVKAPAQLQQAEAQLAQAQAQQYQTMRNYERELSVDVRATTDTDIDQAREQLKSSEAAVQQARAQVATAALIPQQIETAEDTVQQRRAQVEQAKANLAQAEVKLSYNEIRAPQDGWITRRDIELGTYVQAGQQIFYIVTPQVWITANFKETQLAHIRPGDRVAISVDAYPALKLRGHVQSIQLGSGARFTEFPAENATGNFVKIVRRVPVKILIDSGLPASEPLPLGISVEPVVYIK